MAEQQQKGIVRRTIDRLKSLFSLTKSASGERTFAKRSEKEWNDYLNSLMSKPGRGPSGFVMGDERKTKAPKRFKFGTVVTFRYDALHAKTLPYFDRYPLAIMVAPRFNGVLSINIHYLPPPVRIKLLIAILTEEKEGARLVQELFRTPNMEFCFKWHRWDRIQSNIYIIPLEKLPMVAALPVRFITGEEHDAVESKKVWADYYRK